MRSLTACGRICMHRKKISISYTLAGQRVGIKEVDDGIWIVSFMHYDLDFSITRHVGSNRSTTRSSRKCYLCLRYKPLPM
jgi:hypothetical protein